MLTAEKKIHAPTISYVYHNGLYLNLTSRCPSACRFCIKFSWSYQYRGYDLKLPKDPTVAEVLKEMPQDLSRFDEVIYCGYGESTYRLNDLPTLSKNFRERGTKKIRLNTVGLGNAIHGRDIAPDLGKVVDAVSISLNSVDPEKYIELVRPNPEFKERALESVKEFCKSAVKNIADTTITTIDSPDFDVADVKAFSELIGAKFRLRPYLDDYEAS